MHLGRSGIGGIHSLQNESNLKARTHRDEYRRVFQAFIVFTLKRFSLTMSRVNMQIHSLTLDGAYVKQKYPGTQGGAAQLYASDTHLSLRRKRASIYALVKIIQRKHGYFKHQ